MIVLFFPRTEIRKVGENGCSICMMFIPATVISVETALPVLALANAGSDLKITETVRYFGDLILPIAAIRGEGTSNDYFPPEVPALPAFMLQRAVSSSIRDHARDYWTGTVYTTNRRIWEHDEEFKEYLKKTRAMAVDMETATLFSCGFANHIPTGAILLVSDQPMIPEGVKTDKSDNLVTQNYVTEHVEIGIASLRMIIDEKKTVKHLKFDW